MFECRVALRRIPGVSPIQQPPRPQVGLDRHATQYLNPQDVTRDNWQAPP
jgi:hypothetical protein